MDQIIIFVLGLAGLWFGAELVIKGALGLARQFGLSESFIGLIVLALGTDLPEIMVSVTGAIEQLHGVNTSGIIVGNVIGSNMSNMVFVLGSVGLLGGSMVINKKEMWKQSLAVVAATLLFLVLSADGVLSRSEGWMFLTAYLFYFIFVSKTQPKRAKKKHKQQSLWKLGGILLVGIILLGEASNRVVGSGIEIAAALGVSQLVVGAILVGVGTSLPELVVSTKAVLSGADDLSVSNLVGSNIINILLALGIAAVISGLTIERQVAQFDLPFLLFTMIVVAMFTLSRGKLERKESLLLLSLYAVYVALKLLGW
ncbi:MAG: sodium:calcium antiporter [Candidatus Paceibacterota bacterium]